jgi:hypothetical protein
MFHRLYQPRPRVRPALEELWGRIPVFAQQFLILILILISHFSEVTHWDKEIAAKRRKRRINTRPFALLAPFRGYYIVFHPADSSVRGITMRYLGRRTGNRDSCLKAVAFSSTIPKRGSISDLFDSFPTCPVRFIAKVAHHRITALIIY